MDASDYLTDSELRMLKSQKYLDTYFLIVKALLAILLGAYLPTHLSMFHESLAQMGSFLTVFSFMFGIMCIHLMYTNSHLKQKPEERADKSFLNANMLIGFLGMIAFGYGLNHRDFVQNVPVSLVGLITGITLIGIQTSPLDPFTDFSPALITSVIPSFLIITFVNLWYGLASVRIMILMVWITALVVFVPRFLDFYYEKHRNTVSDPDYHIYAALHIFSHPTIIVCTLYMVVIIAVFNSV